jgi:hypothetical protein
MEPVATTSRPAGFPTTMQVDYVRTWKRATVVISCNPAWNSNSTYSVNDKVSYSGKNWNWTFKNPGNCTPGVCSKWADLGICPSSANRTNVGTENTAVSPTIGDTSPIIGNGPVSDDFKSNIGFSSSDVKYMDNVKVYMDNINKSVNINTHGNASVSVFNIQGTMVLNSIEFKDHTSLNIKNLASGVYIVRVANKNRVISKKIIKQ